MNPYSIDARESVNSVSPWAGRAQALAWAGQTLGQHVAVADGSAGLIVASQADGVERLSGISTNDTDEEGN